MALKRAFRRWWRESAANERLLYATQDAIFGLQEGKAAKLVDGLSGQLRCHEHKLYVLTPAALLQIDGIFDALRWHFGPTRLVLVPAARAAN